MAFLLKDLFMKDKLLNVYSKELSNILNKIDPSKIPDSYNKLVSQNLEHNKNLDSHHLLLLVTNQIGYLNLIKLVSISYIEGFDFKPKIDKTLLKKYNEGLIATSACLSGEINSISAGESYSSTNVYGVTWQKGEKEVEAIVFSAAEPLDVDTIESKITKKINVILT